MRQNEASINLIEDDHGVDDLGRDEIGILAHSDAPSLCIQTCGRGWHSNFHTMGSKPPSALSDIDPSVWSRLYHHFWMADMKSKHGCRTIFHVLLIVTFALLLTHFNESLDNMLTVLVLIASVGYKCESWRDYRATGEYYRKIVMKMTPTFQAQGYDVEFIEPPLCTYDRTFTGRWVRFTRIRSPMPPRQQPGCTDEEQPQTEDQLTTFKPEDWQPLEGKWEMMDPSKMKGYMPWLIQTQSMTWTFQNTASEATFESFIESQANMFYSMIPRERTIQQFKLQGNALHMELKRPLSMRDHVHKPLECATYVPIPMDDRRRRSLYKKQHNYIMLVQSPEQKDIPKTLKLIEFEFDEDVPNDELLVTGVLDHLTPEELQEMGGVIRLQLEFQEPTNFV